MMGFNIFPALCKWHVLFLVHSFGNLIIRSRSSCAGKAVSGNTVNLACQKSKSNEPSNQFKKYQIYWFQLNCWCIVQFTDHTVLTQQYLSINTLLYRIYLFLEMSQCKPYILLSLFILHVRKNVLLLFNQQFSTTQDYNYYIFV